MPETIIPDNVTAIIPAVRNVFFVAKRIGCWFHYLQHLHEKNQEIGLRQPHSKVPQIQRIGRRLFSLPFYHQGKSSVFSTIIAMKLNLILEQQPLLGTLFAYVGIFWIWGPKPMALWKVFERPLALRTASSQQMRNFDPGLEQLRGIFGFQFFGVAKKLTEPKLAPRLVMRRFSRREPPRKKKKLKYKNLNEKSRRLKNCLFSSDMYWDDSSAICRKMLFSIFKFHILILVFYISPFSFSEFCSWCSLCSMIVHIRKFSLISMVDKKRNCAFWSLSL